MSEERWQIVRAGLRSIFFDDLSTKAIALLITLVLWYGVTGRRAPTTVRLRGVHLSFQLPTNAEISNDIVVDEVEITVTGDKSRIDRLNPRDLVVAADLSDYKPGDLVVQLKPETVNLDLPSGIKLDAIEPNKISIRLEPRIERLVGVKPVFSGQLPENYEIYESTATPQFVRVRGAASRVNALDKVPTEKIDLNVRTESFVEKQVTLDLLDPKITVLDAVVDIAVKIGEQRIEKTFAAVEVRNQVTPTEKSETAAVTIYGPASVIDNLHANDLSVQIEVQPDNSSVKRVVLPENLQNSNVEVVEIKLNKTSTSKKN